MDRHLLETHHIFILAKTWNTQTVLSEIMFQFALSPSFGAIKSSTGIWTGSTTPTNNFVN